MREILLRGTEGKAPIKLGLLVYLQHRNWPEESETSRKFNTFRRVFSLQRILSATCMTF